MRMANLNQIWDQMEYLCVKKGAINLGHGYADFEPPEIIREAFLEVAQNPSSPFVHQYARRYGQLRLVKILAEMYSSTLGVEVDPLTNIIVTIGAQHALYCAVRQLLKPSDEVIMFEPFVTFYDLILKETGASVIYVPMKLSTSPGTNNLINGCYTFDKEELKSKFNNRTKLLLLNNPNNPSGKAFTRDELKLIAKLCIEFKVTVVSDEVYFRLVHPPHKHISIASLPGMWEQTITLGSAGKCFSVTGWKVGWAIGPEHLVNIVAIPHRTSAYSCSSPLQEAVAIAFEKEKELGNDCRNYANYVSTEIMEKFKRLANAMIPVGLKPLVPEAGYFLTVDTSEVDFEEDTKSEYGREVKFALWMLSQYGIGSVPMGVFRTEGRQKTEDNFLRFCCYKSEETISRAEEAFKTWQDDLEKRGLNNRKT